MEINNPHDKFFKEIFSDKERAVELIKSVLPREIKKNLNYKSLFVEENSYISEEMREYQSDILFSIKTTEKSKIKIYLLFEHKSYLDRNINIQLFSYLTNIYLKMKELSPVIPVIFYHGKKKWTIPLNFIDSFKISEREKILYSKYIPDFTSEIIDLSITDIEKLISSLTLKIILYTFKYIRDFETEERFRDLIILSKELFYEESGLKIIQKLLLYLFSTNNLDIKSTMEIVSDLIPYKVGEALMTTTAERLINQGIEQGINQGIEQGINQGIEQGINQGINKGIELKAIEDAEKMIKKRFSVEDIADITGLSREKILKLM